MAIYHLSRKVVSRSTGRSATGAAAYRASERITDERTGIAHDYTRKGGTVHAEVLLPDGAPEGYRDRSALWNAAEAAEKSERGQVAYEVEVSLPRELCRDDQIALARGFAQGQYVDKGFAADVCIHDKGDGNPHAHIMITTRQIGESGFMPKYRKEYLCRSARGDDRYLTADEMKASNERFPSLAFEKVFKYKNGAQLTRAQAAESGLTDRDRADRHPVSQSIDLTGISGFGRDGNARQHLADIRKAWESDLNRALERQYEREQMPEDEREYVDCRSHRERGFEVKPTIHEGPRVKAVEEREMRVCREQNRAYKPVTPERRQNDLIQRFNDRLVRAYGCSPESAKVLRVRVDAVRKRIAQRMAQRCAPAGKCSAEK